MHDIIDGGNLARDYLLQPEHKSGRNGHRLYCLSEWHDGERNLEFEQHRRHLFHGHQSRNRSDSRIRNDNHYCHDLVWHWNADRYRDAVKFAGTSRATSIRDALLSSRNAIMEVGLVRRWPGNYNA